MNPPTVAPVEEVTFIFDAVALTAAANVVAVKAMMRSLYTPRWTRGARVGVYAKPLRA